MAVGAQAQQQIGDKGSHDLDDHGVSAGAQEVTDPEVLLEPLEEQLDLPARLVERGNLGGRGAKVVAEQGDLTAALNLDDDQPQLDGERIAAGRANRR